MCEKKHKIKNIKESCIKTVKDILDSNVAD